MYALNLIDEFHGLRYNINDYLNTEFVFNGTQLVKSSFDVPSKTISVSLVGTPISEDAIALLQRELKNYNLKGYTLDVTQNTMVTGSEDDNVDKITIAIQENTIHDLQEQIANAQAQLEELENDAIAKLDFTELAKKAESIFTDLSDCSCGVIADVTDVSVILVANAQKELSESEIEIIENWLKTESGIEKTKLFLN